MVLQEHKQCSALIKDNLVPIITPKTPSGNVDIKGIENLVEFHQSLGTRALFAVGGLGRFHELTDEQRIEAAEAFILANTRLDSPLLIFLGATSETEETTLKNMRKYKELGADVIFFAPLFFISPDKIPAFVKKARDQLGPKMPILIYNNPDFSRQDGIQNIEPEVLRGISDYFSAIKDSSCDDDLFSQYASIDVAIYTGNEPALVDAIKKRHSRGSVGGIGNVTGTTARLARELTAAVDDEEEELKIAELTAKFNAEVATLRKVMDAHPDIDVGTIQAAVFHFCLGEAGIVQPSEDLIKHLTEEDKIFLRESGFVPFRDK